MVIGHNTRVSSFSTNVVWNITHCKKNWVRYDKNVDCRCILVCGRAGLARKHSGLIQAPCAPRRFFWFSPFISSGHPCYSSVGALRGAPAHRLDRWSPSVSERRELRAWNVRIIWPEEFDFHVIQQGSFTCRKSATRDKQTALLPFRRKACWGFLRPKKSDGFGRVWKNKCGLVFMSNIRYSCQILVSLEFSRRIFAKYHVSWKSVQWEQSCSMWTDERTDVTKLIVAFQNFANAHKNWLYVLSKFRQGEYFLTPRKILNEL
jgi:hypothetical protein